MRIHIQYAGYRKKPQVGDTKIIQGVLHRRELEIINDPIYGRGHNFTGGRPHFVWVPVVGGVSDEG